MCHVVLVLCCCIGPLVQKLCEQGFCVDVDGKPLAAWAYADDLSLAAGAAWTMTRMLSDFSVELARLGLSLCTEVGKCAWLGIGTDELAPVYLAGHPVTRVSDFCVLGSMINSEDDAFLTV